MSQQKKKFILAAALCGIALGAQAANKTQKEAPQTVSLSVEKCYGINKCKGFNSCEVAQSDIAAVKAKFKNKFAKTSPYSCSGEVKGSAQKGYLGWLYVEAEACLKIEGGFLIEEKDGKKVVVEST
jgi:hypothetical protein